MGWRERHEWFEAAFGPSWRSTVLGIFAIGLGIVLIAGGSLLVAFETTRTMGVAIGGNGLALIASGIAAVWMREEKQHTQDAAQLEAKIRAEVSRDVRAELARPPEEPPHGSVEDLS